MGDQIQQLQEEKTQLAFILEAHKSVCSRVSSESALDVKPICTTSEPRVLVKAEPEIQQSTVRHLTHAEAMEEDQQVTVSTPSCGSQQRTSSGRGAVMQELGSP